MIQSDFISVVIWWFYLLLIGFLFLPLARNLFSRFFDKGYIFSKTLGLAIISYIIFLFGTAHILPFQRFTIFAVLVAVLIVNILFYSKNKFKLEKKIIYIYIFQELLFFLSLLFWSYIKSFQPDIHGLEKFMDFGFMNSILRSSYFPPTDMWFTPFAINYYYFGHLVTAMLMKLTNISPFISYNLMLATIFAFTVTSAFSIVSTITHSVIKITRTSFLSGILSGILLSLGGTLHTIYSLFAAYNPPENPVPFWQLKFLPNTFPNNYWYPNATRFIPLTIHEFPSYSFVVSDLHGHVLDIPFVLLTIAIIYSIFLAEKLTYKTTLIVSFFLAIMYMTNAWDGIIYFGLFAITVLLFKSSFLKSHKNKNNNFKSYLTFLNKLSGKKKFIIEVLKHISLASIGFVIFALPFSMNFKPFVSGIGVLCAPSFLTKIGKIGPLLFEAEHCQRSPFWMLFILYGFFYIFASIFILKIIKLKKVKMDLIFILLLIFISTILILAPEFIYAKDIYPAHYRANTMFKLGYQAFMMLSIVASFSIAYIFHNGKRLLWIPITFVLLILILIYPYFAVNSYFGELKDYKGLNGLSYLKTIHADDVSAILWIQKNINGMPTLLEAQGDSYTDYGRISSNTGIPTVLGWTVHEWLWRGSYSYPQSRLDDVRALYEDEIIKTKTLIKKYDIKFVYIGELERTKYLNLNEEKFNSLGKIIYQKNQTRIYQIILD